MKTPRSVCFIHWRDAAFHTEETHIDTMDLIDLYEVGWVLKETEEQITLGIEHPGGQRTTRLALSIPKINIISRQDFLIPQKRKKRTVTSPPIEASA